MKITQKKAGKVTETTSYIVSADGNALTETFTELRAASPAPITGTVSLARATPAPAGAHVISGGWRITAVKTSDNDVLVTFAYKNGVLSMTDPEGEAYSAKLDSTPAPFTGNANITMVSLKKLSARSIEESDFRDGKLRGLLTMTVAKDGKSMAVDWVNTYNNLSGSYKAYRQ